jgi:hypothetical protein
MKKILLKISFLGVVLFSIVLLFSTSESKYECVGKLEKDNKSSDVVLYMKLKEYRWWVHLWNDSDGIVNVEVPGKYLDVFFHLQKIGDQIQIWKEKGKLIGGYYSTLSQHISLLTDFGNFEGKCKKMER